RSRQASPLGTASTTYPSSRRTPVSAERTPGSSSTIRMVGFTDDGPSARQLDRKPGAARRVIAHVDAAAVLGNDAADDGEAEAAAGLLGGVVRQKQLFALGRGNARAIVGDDEARHVVRGVA